MICLYSSAVKWVQNFLLPNEVTVCDPPRRATCIAWEAGTMELRAATSICLSCWRIRPWVLRVSGRGFIIKIDPRIWE
ncbi:hypothetical protein BDE02_17G117600 [Populus trichocarpa]|nr:hypothetical protein BDE02_17G117600 [Populus trichocarpa]